MPREIRTRLGEISVRSRSLEEALIFLPNAAREKSVRGRHLNLQREALPLSLMMRVRRLSPVSPLSSKLINVLILTKPHFNTLLVASISSAKEGKSNYE